MRFLTMVVLAFFSALLFVACTVNQNDCTRNPNLECYSASGTGTGGTGTSTGSTGTGTGGTACAAAECPQASPGDCQKAACIDNACSFVPEPTDTACGNGLACDGEGHCTCTGAIAARCPSDECNAAACEAQQCIKKPLGAGLLCHDAGGTLGTCSAAGECGSCSDGKLDGAETGVDCGPDLCGKCGGQTCGAGPECGSGFCAGGVCCDTACDGGCMACSEATTGKPDGVCAPVPPGTADPGCNAGGCGVGGFCACADGVLSPGEVDVDCGGLCGPTCTSGQKCSGINDCAGGSSCVDGVCCVSQCEGSCRTCNAPATPGLCVPLSGVDGFDCGGNNECSLLGNCTKATSKSCAGALQCASGFCSNSQCVSCFLNGNCKNESTCLGGYCAPTGLGNGQTCVADVMCAGGACVDGVCCESKCDGKCMACATGYSSKPNGSCAPMLAGHDPQDECTGAGKAAFCGGAPDPNDPTQSSCGSN
jgi:hypothetical protein